MPSLMSRYLCLLLTLFAVGFDGSRSEDVRLKYGCRVDLCFIMDRSGSIGTRNWQLIQSFVKRFVDRLVVTEQSSQVGLVTFDYSGSVVFGLEDYNNDKPNLFKKVDSVHCCGGGTSIEKGLLEARTKCFARGNRVDAADVAVLMTDGQSNVNAAIREGQLLRQNGVSIVVIGVGNNVNRDLLLALADKEDNLFLVSDFTMLLEDTSLILGKACTCEENCCGEQAPNWEESDFPLLHDCPRLSNPIIDGDVFKFECSIDYTVPAARKEEARFLIQFLHNGVPNEKYSIVLTPPDTKATLHEYYMTGHMGQYLRCQVQTYWTSSQDSRSRFVSSRSYWAGITFSEETVTIYETDNESSVSEENVASVYAFSTLPIVCAEETECNLPLQIESNGSVAVYQRLEDKKITRCYYKFFESNWKENESLAYDVQSPLQVAVMRKLVPVKVRYASITMSIQPKMNKLKSTLIGAETVPAGTEYSPWTGYEVMPLQVQVFGGKKRGTCSATTDPHIISFDRRPLNVYEKDGWGIYILFQSKKYKLQIQTYIKTYYIQQIAVNDGGEITIITLTNQMQCEMTDIRRRTTVTWDGRRTYYVRTYSGAVVKVMQNGYYLNVWLDVPPQFWNQTEGLCGTFDDNGANDFKLPGVRDFIKHYRLAARSESLFQCPSYPIVLYEFCQCTGDDANDDELTTNTDVCGMDDALLERIIPSYPVSLLLPRFVLQQHKQNNRLARREAGGELYADNTVEYEPPTVIEYNGTDVQLPAWGTYGLSEQAARGRCTSAILESPGHNLCQTFVKEQDLNIIVTNCVTDIQITGDVSFALDTTTSYQGICFVDMINQATDYVADTENPLANERFKVLFEEFQKISCPGNCNEHGICNDGVCLCESKYTGVDCSVLKGLPPSSVQYLEEDFCDLSERPCKIVRLQADNIVITDDVWCKITIKLHNGSESMTIAKGIIQGPSVVACPKPDNLPPYYMYRVSLSNDRETFVEANSSFTYINVGDSNDMLTNCMEQRKYRPESVTRVINGRCYVTELNEADKKKGMITTFEGLNLTEFAAVEVDIHQIIVDHLNSFTQNNTCELCRALNSSERNNGYQIQEPVFGLTDVWIADGYPRGDNDTKVKWLAALAVSSVEDACEISQEDRQAEKLDINSEFILKAITGLKDDMAQIVSKNVQVRYEPLTETQSEAPGISSQSVSKSDIILITCAAVITMMTRACVLCCE